MKEHNYKIQMEWVGNTGEGTRTYTSYSRNHQLTGTGKPSIPCSSDPTFRGDRSRYNPEELLVGTLSACHMLWFLHLCAIEGIVVVDYSDEATGTMVEQNDGSGMFKEVTLFPIVTVQDDSMIQKLDELHHKSHKLCYIANSCNFPVYHKPSSKVKN